MKKKKKKRKIRKKTRVKRRKKRIFRKTKKFSKIRKKLKKRKKVRIFSKKINVRVFLGNLKPRIKFSIKVLLRKIISPVIKNIENYKKNKALLARKKQKDIEKQKKYNHL